MYLWMLSRAQIERLHEASLHILAHVGVDLPHADLRARFRDAGARVEEATQRAHIPESLVQQSLAQAGRSLTLYGRDQRKQAIFGEGKRNYSSGATEALWVDGETGERRYPTLADVADAVRLADALPHVNVVGAMADPHEFSPNYGRLAVMAELYRNTTKPLSVYFYDRALSKYMVELMVIVAGSEEDAARYPSAYPYLEPISPLRLPVDGLDALYETARLNLPVPIGPMVQTGASGPGTLAGTLALENAEVLAGVCATQLIRPGTPVVYGGVCHAFDMRTTQTIFSGPEQAVLSVAMAQVGRHYGLPVYVSVGLTDSKRPDAQAGMKAGITLLCGAWARAEIFGHLGICGADQAASLEILVMQHELVGCVERILQGVDFDDEHLGLEVIEQVGPGGTLLDQEHTAGHYREELWFPPLLDRQRYDDWEKSGGKSLGQRRQEEKERLLREHRPDPLPAEVERLLTAARTDLGRQGRHWRAA